MRLSARGPPVSPKFVGVPVRDAECDAVQVLVGIEAHLERRGVPHRFDGSRSDSVVAAVVRRRSERRHRPDDADEDRKASQLMMGHRCLSGGRQDPGRNRHIQRLALNDATATIGHARRIITVRKRRRSSP